MVVRFMVALVLYYTLKVAFSHVIKNGNHVENNPKVVIRKESLGTDDVSTSLHSTTVPKAVFEDGILKNLSLEIDGYKITLNLIPVTNDLVDSNLTYVIRDHDNIFYKNQPNFKHCHYRSTNLDVEAAVSNCDGFFKGTIILNGGIYSIEQLRDSDRTSLTTLTESVRTLSESVQTLSETLPESAQTSSEDVRDDSIVHAIYKRAIPEKFCGSDSRRPSKEGRILRDDPVDDNDDDIDMSIVPTSRFSKKSDLTVELGIFVDSELYRRYVDNYTYSYAETKLQDFVTAVFNNIQLLYHHPSMTPKFNLKVVHYEVFKSPPYELSMTNIKNGDAQTYLDAFCNYQYRLTERTWDHSFLLTGIDLIRDGNDRTISGISRLLGVCDTYNSCTLSEGFDFTSSFIGAHEIGHALGMKHDEPNCVGQFIMSNSLGPGKVTWSTCSIADLQRYLDKLDYQGKNCMRTSCCDKVNFELDGNVLPGQKYDADSQCTLFHGPGFRQVKPVSDYPESLCYMTWCGLSKYGRILTSHPAIEGTYCDPGKYCIQGRCAPYSNSAGQPPTVDGSWSTWSPVSCSSCACPLIVNSISALKSVRTCTNPYPSNGGRDCIGDAFRGIICANGSCQKPNRTADSYIKAVCSNHKRTKNDLELTGGGSQLTKVDARACKVFCDIQTESNGQKNFRFFGDFLPDGTQCGSERYCVDGECLSLDCSGSALIKERYSCPKESETCSTQSSASWSTWSTWTSCSVTCGTGVQKRTRTCASSTCSGSKDDVYSCNLPACPSVTIVAPQPPPPQTSSGQWSTWGVWSGCSMSCGKGSLARYRTCKTGSCTGLSSEVRSCEGFSCGNANGVWATWSSWSTCSKTCDSGTTTRTRSCSNNYCRGSSSDSASCNQQLCNNNVRADDVEDGQWGSWSQNDACSVTCGAGIQKHTRSCISGRCQGSSTKEQQCLLSACADWGGWSSWSDCGGQRIARRRIRNCYGAGNCGGGSSFEEKSCWS